MGVHCGVIPFHAPAALGARYTRFVALFVNGRTMWQVRVNAILAIVIGEDMAAFEVGVCGGFLKELKVAVPLREVDNKILGREKVVFLQVFKPLLQNVKGFCVDEKRYIGIIVANIGIEFQMLHILQFSACVETEVLNNILVAILFD